MRGFRWIDPEFASLIADHRLDDLDAPFGGGGGLVTSHRGRVTIRLDLPSARYPSRVVYVKRETWTPRRFLLGNLAAGRGYWTKARAEFEALRELRTLGVCCPRPIACFQQGAWRPRAVLILDELRGTLPVNRYLGSWPRDDGRREQFFTALGREVARLHATGFCQPDLYSNHIHVEEHLGGWKFSFLDFQRCRRFSQLPLRRRVRDLAALAATLPSRLAGQRDLEVFIDAYLADSEFEEQISLVRSGIDRHVAHLLTLRRIWEIREGDSHAHISVGRLESLQAGKMWIDRRYRRQLEESGLANFESMMSTTDGRLLRALPQRENWRIDLSHPDLENSGAYLKKHHVRTARSFLRGKVGAGPGETPGRIEARNVARLARGGIAAMRLIAFGEKLHSDGLLESFLLTEELVGYTQLDHFLRKRFPPRDREKITNSDVDLQRLIRQVAFVASRFHTLGYNHRDLYCCHFFIKELPSGEFQVNLIDLQRVEHRHRLRGRWLVKDLAQLAYSAPRDRISNSQKMAFMKRYLGVKKLSKSDKRFIRRILAKQRRMEQRLGPAS